MWVALLYQGLVVTPAILYLGFVHPDWTWLYLVNPQRLPSGITVLSVLASAAALLGGYLGGWILLRARRRRELMGACALLIVGLGAVLLVLRDRLGHAGTFADYAAGEAARLTERKLGWALGVIVPGTLAALVLSLRFLVVQGRREREG